MSINDLIKEAERELRMRESVYAKWVDSKKISPVTAERQMKAQEGIVRFLKQQKEIFSESNRDNKATLYREFAAEWKPAGEVKQPQLFEDEGKRSHYHESY